MTVRDLIEELEELPMDLPVVNEFQEVTEATVEECTYFLDNSPSGYTYSPAVVLR